MSSFDRVLAGAQTGDQSSWTDLYRHYAPAVLGYLRARGAAEPEDLLAEVFLSVARGLQSFRGDEAGFRSWLFTIAHRRLVDERRSRASRPVDPAAEIVLSPAYGADVVAIEHLEREGMVAELARLAPDQADVLTLRIVGGLTIDEIARLLDKSRGAVKALQRRGLAHLRKNHRGAVPI